MDQNKILSLDAPTLQAARTTVSEHASAFRSLFLGDEPLLVAWGRELGLRVRCTPVPRADVPSDEEENHSQDEPVAVNLFVSGSDENVEKRIPLCDEAGWFHWDGRHFYLPFYMLRWSQDKKWRYRPASIVDIVRLAIDAYVLGESEPWAKADFEGPRGEASAPQGPSQGHENATVGRFVRVLEEILCPNKAGLLQEVHQEPHPYGRWVLPTQVLIIGAGTKKEAEQRRHGRATVSGSNKIDWPFKRWTSVLSSEKAAVQAALRGIDDEEEEEEQNKARNESLDNGQDDREDVEDPSLVEEGKSIAEAIRAMSLGGDWLCPVVTSEQDPVRIRYRAFRDGKSSVSLPVHIVPFWQEDEPTRLLVGASLIQASQTLAESDVPKVQSLGWRTLAQVAQTHKILPGRNLLTAFAFFGGWTHEDALVISESAARKLKLGRKADLQYHVRWLCPPGEVDRLRKQGLAEQTYPRGWRPLAKAMFFPVEALKYRGALWFLNKDFPGVSADGLTGRAVLYPSRFMSCTYADDVQKRAERSDSEKPVPNICDGKKKNRNISEFRGTFHVKAEEVPRPCQAGDKLANLHGNKGVVARVVPDEDMPWVDVGGVRRRIEVVANPIGVLNRGNFGQLAEALASWLASDDRPVREPDLDLDSLGERLSELGAFDDAGRLLLHWPGKARADQHCVVGWNFWLRMPQEASSKASLVLAKEYKTALSKALLPSSLRKKKGVVYGEMNSWALGVKEGARAWIQQDLFSRREGSAYLLWRIDEGWGEAETKIDEGAREVASSRFLTWARALAEVTGGVPWVAGTQAGGQPFDTLFSKLLVQEPKEKDSRSGRHMLAWTGTDLRKKSKLKNRGIRHSNLVQWALAHRILQSGRLVIAPGPHLDVDEVELPWWFVFFLFLPFRDADGQFPFWSEFQNDCRHFKATFHDKPLWYVVEGLSHELPARDQEALGELRKRFEESMAKVADSGGLGGLWALVHRDPVISHRSIWPLRVRLSEDPAPVARLPLLILPGMGADFDGDMVGIVPVLNESPEIASFVRESAPSVESLEQDAGKELKMIERENAPNRLRQPDLARELEHIDHDPQWSGMLGLGWRRSDWAERWPGAKHAVDIGAAKRAYLPAANKKAHPDWMLRDSGWEDYHRYCLAKMAGLYKSKEVMGSASNSCRAAIYAIKLSNEPEEDRHLIRELLDRYAKLQAYVQKFKDKSERDIPGKKDVSFVELLQRSLAGSEAGAAQNQSSGQSNPRAMKPIAEILDFFSKHSACFEHQDAQPTSIHYKWFVDAMKSGKILDEKGSAAKDGDWALSLDPDRDPRFVLLETRIELREKKKQA